MSKKTIIIIVSVILVLALAIGGTIALFGSSFSDDSGKDKQSNVTSSDSSNVDSSNTDTDQSTDETDENIDADVSVPKAEKDMTTFIVGKVEAQKGGKVSVPVYVSSNKGFMAVLGSCNYDTTALKYTGFKKGNLFSDHDLQETNGTIKFINMANNDVTKDGIAFTLEFDVIAENPTTTPVSVTINPNGIGNKAEQYVDVDTIDGSVTIK